jgi:hypothetical protein
VRSISEYPLPASTVYSTIKEYAAEIAIEEPEKGVRTGMTAQVAIEVKRLDAALQVPVQAVLERGKKFFCMVSNSEGAPELRRVSVDSANGQMVIIKDGLALGEEVMLAPQNYEDAVTFPEGVPATDPHPKRPSKPKVAAGAPASPASTTPSASSASSAKAAKAPGAPGASKAAPASSEGTSPRVTQSSVQGAMP